MKTGKYKIRLKIPSSLHARMLKDLKRSHYFAFERVGFLYTKTKILADNTVLVLAIDYVPVSDEDYVKDNTVGAKINSTAIRKSMQKIIDNKCGCFHVHLHNHLGSPSPSQTDQIGLPGVADSFFNVAPKEANGILILSENSFYASVKVIEKDRFNTPELISVIGYPMRFIYPGKSIIKNRSKTKIYARQSFLGDNTEFIFKRVKVGIIGYGGGGSHIGQQLAHLGVENIFVFDNDKIEDTNHNRLIGGWFSDIAKTLSKTSIAKRIIKKILPTAKVTCINSRWQDSPEILQACDIILACVDSFAERQQLEAECRRYLIPCIDIGMDVHKEDGQPYSMSGQIILSMPGQPCMTCMGFLTEKKLAIEAAKYGKVGGRPQVVWPNGVLASTAVGILVDILTSWTRSENKLIYLSYDGNTGTLSEHVRLKYCEKDCKHFPYSETGTPVYKQL